MCQRSKIKKRKFLPLKTFFLFYFMWDCDIVPVSAFCTVLLAGSSAEPVPDCGTVAVADSALPGSCLWYCTVTVANSCQYLYW
jgi:hypothetical protein